MSLGTSLALLLAAVGFGIAAWQELRLRRATADLQRSAAANAELTRQSAEQRSQWEHHAAELQRELDRLHPYRTIVDAQAFAAGVRAQADALATEAVQNAQVEATRLIDNARTEAQKAAEQMRRSVEDAKRYEQTARAMRNIIDGYGDAYVVPASGLLDELGESFAFTEAGQQLKAAREASRQIVREGGAATCEYVEVSRRNTALNFVLDYFNTKVEAVLSDVRHDNFGTMEQRIRDALALVNGHGKAFRDARIEQAYLDARLVELRWAVAAQELKLRDQEEQRALKAKMREEARVQRELEKAIRDAQKDEESVRKAMEKTQSQIEKATGEQRAKYEAQLRELTQKLQQAEERNRRAVSMAQQTKAGHVYIISNLGSFGDGVFKIGMTRRLEPQERVDELGAASVPFDFDVHAMIPTEDAPGLELALHRRFVRNLVNKVNFRKEFFRVPLHEVRAEIERIGVGVAWTISAGAQEYRETLAIDQAMAANTFDVAAWLGKRLRAAEQYTDEPPMVAVEDESAA